MKNSVRIWLSWLMLSAFLFAITPKEFIHELSGHEDTKECNSGSTTSVSQGHIHCQILQLQVNPFDEPVAQPLPVKSFLVEIKNDALPESHSCVPSLSICLRGPPSVG